MTPLEIGNLDPVLIPRTTPSGKWVTTEEQTMLVSLVRNEYCEYWDEPQDVTVYIDCILEYSFLPKSWIPLQIGRLHSLLSSLQTKGLVVVGEETVTMTQEGVDLVKEILK